MITTARMYISIIMAMLTALGVIGGENESGLLGYLYEKDGNYFYTADEAWQGTLGYNGIYDFLAPGVVMYYETVNFKFEYEDKDWMVQLWRGQYGWLFVGAEIGVYTKPRYRLVEHYSAAEEEDWLPMSFNLKRWGFWDVINTKTNTTWWCTGFVPGSLVIMTWQDQLQMEAVITVKDQTMLNAFTAAIAEQGGGTCSYKTDGLTVRITF